MMGVSSSLALILIIPFALILISVLMLWVAPSDRPLWLWLAVMLAGCTVLSIAGLVDFPLQSPKVSVGLGALFEGMSLTLSFHPIAYVFALVVSLLWVVTLLYSIAYMKRYAVPHPRRFFLWMTCSIGATLGVAFADNLLTLFVCYEALSFFTYPLVVYLGGDQAKRAGRFYLFCLVGASLACWVPALVMVRHYQGDLLFQSQGSLRAVPYEMGAWILGLLMIGTAKTAMIPWHGWLPRAMVAHTPVSALLHAVAVVKVGILTVVKIVAFIYGFDYLQRMTEAIPWVSWISWLAVATTVTAGVAALFQHHIKQLLAYSTISQLGYCMMAATLWTQSGVEASLLHMLAHALGKITLFLSVGVIYAAVGSYQLSKMDGMGRLMPWSMGAFAIAAGSMIGIPPMVGALSKWYIITAALEAQRYEIVIALLISGLCSAAYFLPLIYRFFWKTPTSAGLAPSAVEVPMLMTGCVIAMAIATLVVGCWGMVGVGGMDMGWDANGIIRGQ